MIVNVGKGLTQSTVTAVLRKLLHANLVEVAGVTHSGKVLSRTYSPTPYSREAILKDFTETYECFSSVISKADLMKALLDANKDAAVTKKEITEIKKALKDFE